MIYFVQKLKMHFVSDSLLQNIPHVFTQCIALTKYAHRCAFETLKCMKLIVTFKIYQELMLLAAYFQIRKKSSIEVYQSLVFPVKK